MRCRITRLTRDRERSGTNFLELFRKEAKRNRVKRDFDNWNSIANINVIPQPITIRTFSLSLSLSLLTQVSKRFETKLALVLHFYHPYGYTLHALRLADTRQGWDRGWNLPVIDRHIPIERSGKGGSESDGSIDRRPDSPTPVGEMAR